MTIRLITVVSKLVIALLSLNDVPTSEPWISVVAVWRTIVVCRW